MRVIHVRAMEDWACHHQHNTEMHKTVIMESTGVPQTPRVSTVNLYDTRKMQSATDNSAVGLSMQQPDYQSSIYEGRPCQEMKSKQT